MRVGVTTWCVRPCRRCQGEGLGKDGTGIAVPVEVEVLPANTSLDFIHDDKDAARRKVAAEGVELVCVCLPLHVVEGGGFRLPCTSASVPCWSTVIRAAWLFMARTCGFW